METRPRFPVECEAAINQHINLQLHVSACYQAMACHFQRSDVALPEFHKLFRARSTKIRKTAQKLMQYQNQRGGNIAFFEIKRPDQREWVSALHAVTSVLMLEKRVYQALLNLHAIAEKNYDVQMMDFIESEFMEEQVKDMKDLADRVTQLRQVEGGVGEYLYDVFIQPEISDSNDPMLQENMVSGLNM